MTPFPKTFFPAPRAVALAVMLVAASLLASLHQLCTLLGAPPSESLQRFRRAQRARPTLKPRPTRPPIPAPQPLHILLCH
mgnify:CR=1 FL=1